MERYLQLFGQGFANYANWLAGELTDPRPDNWVVVLLAVSAGAFVVERLFPWRKQAGLRKDFWLDAFYVVFNFFIFSLLGYAALSEVAVVAFNDILSSVGITNLVAVELGQLPVVAQLAIFFVLRDFIHWNVHRLLHRVPRLWEFHKVHHSVLEMGFAAHLRYHPVETVVYRTLEYLPMAALGFGLTDFFIVHTFALAVGHLNHSNVRLPLGPFRFIFNSPQMHIWHHAKAQPSATGCNFGITLSLWDWIFGTAHWPHDSPNEPLGFDAVEEYPSGFFGQLAAGFRRRAE